MDDVRSLPVGFSIAASLCGSGSRDRPWRVWEPNRHDFGVCFESTSLPFLCLVYLLIVSVFYLRTRLRRRRGEAMHAMNDVDRKRKWLAGVVSVCPVLGVALGMALPNKSGGGGGIVFGRDSYEFVFVVLVLAMFVGLFRVLLICEVRKGVKEGFLLKIFLMFFWLCYSIKMQSILRMFFTPNIGYSWAIVVSYSISYVTLCALLISFLFFTSPRTSISALVLPLNESLLSPDDWPIAPDTSNRSTPPLACTAPHSSTRRPSLMPQESVTEEKDAEEDEAEIEVVERFYQKTSRVRTAGSIHHGVDGDGCVSGGGVGLGVVGVGGGVGSGVRGGVRSGRQTVLRRGGNPEAKAGLLSKCYFIWMNSLIQLGRSRALTDSDLNNLRPDEKARFLSRRVENEWREEVRCSPPGGRSIVKVFCRLYGMEIITAGCFKFCYDMMLFIGPILLNRIIMFLQTAQDPMLREPMWVGYMYVGIMFTANCLQSIILQQYFHRMIRVGMRLRSSISTMIYAKALRVVPGMAGKKRTASGQVDTTQPGTSTGEIVNLMSVDSQRLETLMTYLHILWSAPLQIFIAVCLLYRIIGPSTFGGVAVMTVSIPVTGLVAKRIKHIQDKIMKVKDERIRVCHEMLSGMKIIKLYSWERSFVDKVMGIREKELARLWQYQITIALSRLQWMAVPCMVSVASLGLYVLLGNQLDAGAAFTSLALFNLLRFPMQLLPYMINNLSESRVSVNRIADFLETPELPPRPIIPIDNGQTNIDANTKVDSDGTERVRTRVGERHDESGGVHSASVGISGTPTIRVEGVKLTWADSSALLDDVSFRCDPGTITAIIGLTGSGKSGLLDALIGELSPQRGLIEVRGSVAYCAQVAWIQNGSVQDNICFGSEFDPNWYDEVIECCALKQDLDMLPAGDMTEIGEKGINLSGGQKQRVALARAVYRRSDVYILDDCLSAVDALVASELCSKCLLGLLRSKTVVLVTHKLDFLPHCDQIVFLNDRRALYVGSYDQVKITVEYDAFSAQLEKEEEGGGEEHEEEPVMNEEAEEGIGAVSKGLMVEGTIAEGDKEDEDSKQRITVCEETKRSFTVRAKSGSGGGSGVLDGKRSRAGSDIELKQKLQKEFKQKQEGALIEEEYLQSGKVSWSVYFSYVVGAGGVVAALSVLFAVSASNMAQVGANGWLSYWSDRSYISNSNGLGVYAGILLLQVCLSFLSLLCVAVCSQRAARYFHEGLLKGVLRAPMSFFDTTPLGRLLNRFSKDTYTVDELLPATFVMYLNTLFGVLSTFLVVCFVTPWFMCVAVPLLIFYASVQNYYIPSSRQLQRIESANKSPVFAHFSETLCGKSTIRAFHMESIFMRVNEFRVDNNCRAYYFYVSSNRWLAMRLELVGTFVMSAAALLCIVASDFLAPGMGGLAISYGINVTQTLNWLVRMASDLESNTVSLERLVEYSKNIAREAPSVIPETKPDADWPRRGAVEFRKYSLKYRPDQPTVLKSLNLCVDAGEKIGIVGRTGAGKSSMLVGLLRLVEATEGEIYVDGVDIGKIGLDDLRSRFSIIPQDPVLFSGTIRFNLDPFDNYQDRELWRALEHAHLKSHISGLGEDPLMALVEEGGTNFSMGQRQLLCLARALLRKSHILLLDEATSVVDPQTDRLIQSTIRQEFSDCTILTIAHRLQTILDYDKVLVLDDGTVKEFDQPKMLYANKNSLFRSLALEAGISSSDMAAATAAR
eukprot:GHVQ01034965.1.p1 GENE.GHVQ01034965.1~~GHVQ01034965.1.p1  ORF type:complete len:1721 (-),score=244.53 GHVQ01034965.1:456-5618(-)